MKRCVCAILSFIMCIALIVSALAVSSDEAAPQDPAEMSLMSIDFSSMSIEELNEFIHNIAIQSSGGNDATSRAVIVNLAWIAAAEIASKSGYPCAGAIVKSSALGEDYIESNGLLAKTIETTAAFAHWKLNFEEESIVFERPDNIDLAYAIHKADIRFNGNSSGGRAIITDTFDFDFETDMEGLFATIINDWGWLSQFIGALYVINVQVDIRL